MDTAIEKFIRFMAKLAVDQHFKEIIGKTPQEIHLESIRSRRSFECSTDKSIAELKKALQEEKDPKNQDIIKKILKIEMDSKTDLSIDDALQLALDTCPPAIPYLQEIPEAIEKEGSAGLIKQIKLSLKHMNRWTGEEAQEVKKTFKEYINRNLKCSK